MSAATSPTTAAPRVVLFDVDGTLVRGNGLWHLGQALAEDGLVPRRALARMAGVQALYALGLRSLDEAMGRAYGLVEGLRVGDVEACAARVVAERLAPRVFVEAAARIRGHRARGDRVVLASAGPAFLVERVGALVGVDEVVATRYATAGGRFGAPVAPMSFGPGKVEAARRAGLLAAAPHVYTDHAGDADLVLAASFATLVNPMRALVARAVAHGVPHEVVRWRETAAPRRDAR